MGSSVMMRPLLIWKEVELDHGARECACTCACAYACVCACVHMRVAESQKPDESLAEHSVAEEKTGFGTHCKLSLER